MMKRLVIFSLSFAFLHYAFAQPSAIIQKNIRRLKETCQCPKCDLEGANLQHFRPASQKFIENPFLMIRIQQDDTKPSIVCNLSNANLKNADLDYAYFKESYIDTTSLKSASFVNANFDYATLAEADFQFNDFEGASFVHANLQKTNLSGANLSHANFSNANLTFVTAIITPKTGSGAKMRYANFSQANLAHANLYGDFIGANFSRANLRNAKLSTSMQAIRKYPEDNDYLKDMFRGVDFAGANLFGATISIKDTNGTDGSLQENLRNAIFCLTIMPDGKINNRDCPRLDKSSTTKQNNNAV